MEGSTILIIAIIVAIVVAVIIILIVFSTINITVFPRNQGVDDRGTWKTVGTPLGKLPSYYFNGTLINSQNQYLTTDGDVPVLGNLQTIWNFNGVYLQTAGLYLSLGEGNQLIITTNPITSWLFDGYNFYLTQDLASVNPSLIDPLNLQLITTNNLQLYQPTVGWKVNG